LLSFRSKLLGFFLHETNEKLLSIKTNASSQADEFILVSLRIINNITLKITKYQYKER
jgi:hypothetical protein